ncbi:MAG TPA: bifunctional oligoribonuclease/PAP phosphatase NrnA, partial [Firmicutes bacterium]|nr:bifunctional oligoribonuclease/PAP phosphatase NrnA [Bacillota bacterium]
MSRLGSPAEVAVALRRHRRFLVTAHVHPDGDAVGSVLAVGWILRRLGKEARLVLPERVPAAYTFLPGQEAIEAADELGPEEAERCREADAVVVVDCSDYARLGKVRQLLPEEAEVINVDHHLQNEFDGPRYVRTDAAATGELVYELAKELDLRLDCDAATCLYTALLTDTGSFRFANTTAETLHIAAELLGLGVSPSCVAEQVYDVRPLGALRLLAEVLATLQVTPCGRVAWLEMDEGMLERHGVDASETEGIVNYARTIAGVKIGALFRGVGPSLTRVSWRSRPGYDVARLAARFGGGGHVNAAGCDIPLPVGEAAAKGVAAALEAIEEAE